METIHSWAIGICSAAIISSVCAILTPSGALEKSTKTVVSIFLICSIILPIFKNNAALKEDVSINFAEAEENSAMLKNEVSKETEVQLKSVIESILQKNGITCKDIVIKIKSQEESIDAASVTIYYPDTDAETVKELLKNEAGINANVVM